MYVRYTITIYLCLCLLSEASAQNQEKKTIKEVLSPSALLEWETAYSFEDQNIQKSELIFKPEFDIELGKKVRWVVIGRLYTEFMDNLEPGKPDQQEVSDFSRRLTLGDQLEAELREFYFDIKIKKSYVTIGKQQIVWGKADGLRIMDLVNPFNFREFLLDEFEDSRIPLWAIKVDLPIKSMTLQFIWTPDQTYHDLPDAGGTYAFGRAETNASQVRLLDLNKPDRWIKDSDLGFRLSTFKGGWDLTINYLYSYDDFPTYFQSIGARSAITVSPNYTRNHLLGGTFSNAFGSVTLRGEMGYFRGKYFSSATTHNDSGLIKANQLMSVIGLDYTGITNTTLSGQLFVDWVNVQESLTGRHEVESTMSLLINRTFLNETLTSDLIWIQNLNRSEGFVQGKIKYLLRSNLNIWVGGEWIYGPDQTSIGQFNDQDRIYFGMELGF